MDCSTPGSPIHHQLLEPAQTHVHWVSDAIQTSHPRSSPFLPAFNLSQHQGILQGDSSLHQVANNSIGTSASASVLPMNIHDWFPLWLTGSILQSKGLSRVFYNSWKESILGRSEFFMVQLSHPYMTTGKTIALTRQTFAGKGMSLFFNILSRLAIAFLSSIKECSTGMMKERGTLFPT